MSGQNLTLSDIRTMALAMMGDTTTDSRFGPVGGATGSLVDLWINAALQDMTTDWLGVEDFSTQLTVVDQRLYSLPTGFRMMKQAYYNGSPLEYRAVIDQDFFDTGNTYCDRYSLWKDGLILGPLPPSAVVNLDLYYWRSPMLMKLDGDVPEVPNEYREALACYAASRMAMGDGETGQAQALKQEYASVRIRFNEWIAQKTTSNMQVRNVTGSGWYFWR